MLYKGFAAVRAAEAGVADMPVSMAIEAFIRIRVFLGADSTASGAGSTHMQPVAVCV